MESTDDTRGTPEPASTASQPWLPSAVQAGILWWAIGFAVVVALQCGALGGDLTPFVSKNKIDAADRNLILITGAAAGLCLVLGWAVYILVRRNHEKLALCLRLARVARPLLLLPAVPMLFNWRAFQGKPFLLLLAGALCALALERAFYSAFVHWRPLRFRLPQHRVSDWLRRLVGSRRIPLFLAVGISVAFGAYFSYYMLVHHYRFQTHSYDLAIFNNIMWNLLDGHWFKASPVLGRTGSHIQYHANFGAFLVLPIYALRKLPDTLLVMQACLLGAGAVPIFLLARRRLGNPWLALAMAYAFAVYAPAHGPAFYDFHFLTSAPFLVAWTLYFFESERKWGLVIFGVIALLWREDVSATLAAAALFYLIDGKRPGRALVCGVVAIVYFIVVKFVIMPLHTSGQKETFAWIFGGLLPENEKGFGPILKTVFGNPVFTFETMLDMDKAVYLLQLLVPVVFLPLRNGLTWILLVPAAFFTLLSTGYKPVYQIYFQYTANWTPFVLFGAIAAMGTWVDKRRVVAAVLGICFGSTLVSYHFGAIFQHNTFRGGFRQVVFEWTEKDAQTLADFREVAALIPPNASVTATETEAPHLSSREDCFTMRFGYHHADYILVSLDEVRPQNKSREMLLAGLRTGDYAFVTSKGRFALWKRGGKHERDEEGLRLLNAKL